MEAVYQQKYLKYKAKYASLSKDKRRTRHSGHYGGADDWDELEGGSWNPFKKTLTLDEINRKVEEAKTANENAVAAVDTAIANLKAAFTEDFVKRLFVSDEILAPFLSVANSVAGLTSAGVINAPSSSIANKYATGSAANAFNNDALNAVSLLATTGTTKINESIRTSLNRLLNGINDATEAARKAKKALGDAQVEQVRARNKS